MKLAFGLSALLLGTTLLAGSAMADDPHPHFSAHHEHAARSGSNGTAPAAAPAAQAHTSTGWSSWSHSNNARRMNNNWHASAGNPGRHSTPYWSSTNLHDHNVAHFNAQQRTTWQHGRWRHGNHNGRSGWWWYTGGDWFFYNQPIYPYPGYVSDYYYTDDYDDYGDDGYYGDYGPAEAAGPSDGGYYWYYCENPAGYYPYVKSCRGPWRAVTPTPDTAQPQGYDQGPDAYDNDDDRGPPPSYRDQAPRGDQFNGAPDDDRGPPPGYDNDDQGPPPGYDDGPDDNGPPPPPR